LRKIAPLLLSLILVSFAGYLVQRYSARKEALKFAYRHLSQNFLIDDYLDEKSQLVLANYEFAAKTAQSMSSVRDASSALRAVIKKIDSKYIAGYVSKEETEDIKPSDARQYFHKRTELIAETGDLWEAVQQYRARVENYLESQVYPRKEHYATVLAQDTKQFSVLEQKILQRRNGIYQEPFYLHLFADTMIRHQLQATRTDTGIEWMTPLYTDYIAFLRQKLEPGMELRIKYHLEKISNSFPSEDRISIYNKTYNLDDLTISELSMICTFLELEVLSIDEALIRMDRQMNSL
jgi:hypothetical protein